MRLSPKADAALIGALLLAATAALAAAPPASLSLGQLAVVERLVEQAAGPDRWRKAREGTPLAIGERLRTGSDAVAGLELPWMSAVLGPATVVSFPDAFVLSTLLEQGRLELHAPGRDILKLVTAEAEIRGRGRLVVRRQGGRTLVMALSGRFLVEGAGKLVVLTEGKGTIVRGEAAPMAPVDLARAPEGLWPGADPVYVAPGQSLALRWKGKGPGHQVEVLPIGSELVLMQREVGGPPWQMEIPWTGAFRWRVAMRDDRGLESMPSEGLICVVEK